MNLSPEVWLFLVIAVLGTLAIFGRAEQLRRREVREVREVRERDDA